MNEQNYYKITKILSVFGILLAVYLYVTYLTKPEFSPCSINAQINCDAVTKGPIKEFAGLPVPLFGLVGYVIILIGAFVKKPKLMFAMAMFGTLFCLRLTFIEIFQLQVICPVCAMCQVDMLALTYLTWFKKPKNIVGTAPES